MAIVFSKSSTRILLPMQSAFVSPWQACKITAEIPVGHHRAQPPGFHESLRILLFSDHIDSIQLSCLLFNHFSEFQQRQIFFLSAGCFPFDQSSGHFCISFLSVCADPVSGKV